MEIRSRLIRCAFTAVVVISLISYSAVSAAAAPQRLIIGLDLSESNILVSNQAFASKAAGMLKGMISRLPPRSKVSLRTFGNYDFRSNTVSHDWEIGLKTIRPEYVAEDVAQIVSAVPNDIKSGRLSAQHRTNVLGFLDNMSAVTQCPAMRTSVILVSDGVEDSSITNLTRRSRTLPKPRSTLFAGCDQLIILGIGQKLRNPKDTERLKAEWSAWAQAAGFQRFTGLNDW